MAPNSGESAAAPTLSSFQRKALRGLANPNVTPEPAKAPWYFAGLQELLSRFDPLVAGILVPAGAVLAFVLLPYIDRNPATEARNRKVAVTLFTILLVIAVVLTVVGTQRIAAIVTDRSGVTRTKEITVQVTLAPPMLQIITPADNSSSAGAVRFAARAFDYRDGDRSTQIRSKMPITDSLPAWSISAWSQTTASAMFTRCPSRARC